MIGFRSLNIIDGAFSLYFLALLPLGCWPHSPILQIQIVRKMVAAALGQYCLSSVTWRKTASFPLSVYYIPEKDFDWPSWIQSLYPGNGVLWLSRPGRESSHVASWLTYYDRQAKIPCPLRQRQVKIGCVWLYKSLKCPGDLHFEIILTTL